MLHGLVKSIHLKKDSAYWKKVLNGLLTRNAGDNLECTYLLLHNFSQTQFQKTLRAALGDQTEVHFYFN